MIYALILFAILNAADGYTTWQALRFGAKELNPLLRWCFTLIGPYNTLLLTKILMLVAVWKWMPVAWLPWFCAGYAALIISNYIQLLKQKEKVK